MKRREFLITCGSVAAALHGSLGRAAVSASSRLGLVTYCCRIRANQLRKADPPVDLSRPLTFLEHSHRLGAGGIQIDLGVLSAEEAKQLRDKADDLDMFVEGIVSVPNEKTKLDDFTEAMRTAASVGVAAVRTTIIPGRRYEYFDSLEKFREYESRGRRALELAAPIAEKHKVPVAVENHKDHRNAERVALFEHIGSEYVGACVDTGNSVALLEDPLETIEALAPWAHSVHLKDQAVKPYEDGFLLADIPLGQGCLDLKKMVEILRAAKPNVHFSLELITRDPLKVPTNTEQYWQTFPELPAKYLARTMRLVRDHAAGELQHVSTLNEDDQVAREDENVRASIEYARRELNL